MSISRRGRWKSKRTRSLARAAGRRSKFEMTVEAALNGLLGREVEYESTRLEYVKRAAYVPDFKDGEVLYEAKGRFLSKDRSKLLAVKEAHPNVDLRLVFQRDNKLSKDSDTTYMEWAAKHGFPASVYPDLPIGDLCPPAASKSGNPPKRRKAAAVVPKRRSCLTSKRPRT